MFRKLWDCKHEQKHTRQSWNFLVFKVVKCLPRTPPNTSWGWKFVGSFPKMESIRSVVVSLGITLRHVKCTIPAPLNGTGAIHCNTGLFVYSWSVKDKSNDLLPQSRSADKCSDPEIQRYGRTKPGRREHVLGNWSLTQWDVSVAVRTTSKLHTALPQKTWRGAAQDMSFRIQPAGEKNHKPDVFKTAMRIHVDFYWSLLLLLRKWLSNVTVSEEIR